MSKAVMMALQDRVSKSEVFYNGELFSLADQETGKDFVIFAPTINFRTKTFTALVSVNPSLNKIDEPAYFRVANMVIMDDVPALHSDEALGALMQTIDLLLQKTHGGMFRIHALVHASNGVHIANTKFMDFNKTAFVIRKNEFLQFYNTQDRTKLPKDLAWVGEISYRGQVFQVCSRIIRDLGLDAERDSDAILSSLAPYLPNIF